MALSPDGKWGWTVFHLPSTLGACRRVVGGHSVAYTRRAPVGGPRPRFLDDAAGASDCLLPARRLRSLVALGLHPVVARGNRRRFHGLAEPTVAACLRRQFSATTSLPGAAMYVQLELAWHGRCACLSAMAYLQSAYYFNVRRQDDDSFQHVIYESIIISAQFSATSQKWLQEELDSAHNVQKNPSSRQQERNVQNLVRPFAV